MDQFLAEGLGEEWRWNHQPSICHHVSDVRRHRLVDERPGSVEPGHDEVTELTRTDGRASVRVERITCDAD